MNLGKQCASRAVIFIDGEKAKVRCQHYVDYHHDQAIEDELVPLPHSVRFADGVRVTWERDGQIVYV
ncbi:hypothetical protein [Microbacterium sp. YJN-G]|uniref:hypothetical protein n=1 Tax=Microbacterium sp. YJN-G TaxID=2763257 RepID=UPI001878666D|nr:hypothetical protein [Microbacterium sp. YJN-G]